MHRIYFNIAGLENVSVKSQEREQSHPQVLC